MTRALDRPVVSIGMFVYNGEAFIARALKSLLAQSFTDFELLISDNASTDGTAAVCRKVIGADPRVRLVTQPYNIGAQANLDFVLRQARAPFFMWAAHDDEWHPDFIRECLARHCAEPDCGVVMSRWELFGHRSGRWFTLSDFPPFAELRSSDPAERVRCMATWSNLTHKANFIYGLWRTDEASAMADAFADIHPSAVAAGADIAMLTFAAARSRLVLIDRVLFRKGYRVFAMGSLPQRVLIRAIRLLARGRAARVDAALARARHTHVELVERALERAGVAALPWAGVVLADVARAMQAPAPARRSDVPQRADAGRDPLGISVPREDSLG